MNNIKTIVLDGTETKVDGLAGQNTNIQNLSDAPIYASAFKRIIPGADGVAEIPAGGSIILYDTYGTVYLFGEGRAQLTGTNRDFMVSSSGGSSGGGGSAGGVSQSYVDARDAATLAAAKQYTDENKSDFVLEPATETTLGGVKIGEGLETAPDGTASAPYASKTKILELIDDHIATEQDVDDLLSGIFDI